MPFRKKIGEQPGRRTARRDAVHALMPPRRATTEEDEPVAVPAVGSSPARLGGDGLY